MRLGLLLIRYKTSHKLQSISNTLLECMVINTLVVSRDVATDKVDVGALLTKYARASLQNGIKVFSSRKISA